LVRSGVGASGGQKDDRGKEHKHPKTAARNTSREERETMGKKETESRREEFKDP